MGRLARTKIKHRTYNLRSSQVTENNSREGESLLTEEPPEAPVTAAPTLPQDEIPTIQAKASEVPLTPASPTLPVPTEGPGTSEQEALSMSECQEPPEAPVTAAPTLPQDEIPTIQAKASEVPLTPASPTLPVPTEGPGTSEQEALSMSECQDAPTVECQDEVPTAHVADTVKLNEESVIVREESFTITSKSQDNSLDNNDDSLELDWSLNQDESGMHTQLGASYLDDDSLSISRDSPLNLAWDSSIKENYRQRATAPNFRPITPDNLIVPVDEIFSPRTQNQLRTSIRALFPNGPPPPPPIRPIRRPKKGDVPYIVNCTKRPRVPSPKSLRVFTGDNYGITSTSNLEVDEEVEENIPEKRARRAGNCIKSAFNSQTNEIAERLKLYEKIDRLVGRTPKNQPAGYMTKRSFSPLPSTSTDSETIMKNDKHFSESLGSDNFDIDEDDELPEVILDSSTYKKDKNRKKLSPYVIRTDIKSEKNYTDSILIEVNDDIDDMNNNNDVIALDNEFCEIDFDKLMPNEKIVYYSDVEAMKEADMNEKSKIDRYFLSVPKNPPATSSTVPCATTSTEVICVDDVCTTNINNPVIQASTSFASPIPRTSNKNATATETRPSDLVIEMPDGIEPLNMSRHHTRSPAWSDDVQFVSEERIDRPNDSSNAENVADVQLVSPPSPQFQQFLTRLTESYTRRKTRQRKNTKRNKSKENSCATASETTSPSVNDENTAPVNIETATVSSNGNPAPVNPVQTPETDTTVPSANSSPSKRLGECPICLDNLPRSSIASTNCGHVFCLECIKQSLKTSGKRCPTCRKQLRGVGYHQVFL